LLLRRNKEWKGRRDEEASRIDSHRIVIPNAGKEKLAPALAVMLMPAITVPSTRARG
jgi:hypothetical protein